MSRLYAKLYSDTRNKPVTTTGDKVITVCVYYGSKDDSQSLIELNVTWKEGDEKPSIDWRTI